MTRQILAEFLGTALLLMGVVGSGIMASNLTEDIALALLANAIATGCILYVIITIFGPISGAHFNPVVTLAFARQRGQTWPRALAYIAAQIGGGILGVWLAHIMFELPILQSAATARAGTNQWVSEIVATIGLLLVIFGGLRARAEAVPGLVACYITGAYWFTSSTSFANPAVTIARGFTDTFAGIDPAHIAGFIIAQFVGLGIALLLLKGLLGEG